MSVPLQSGGARSRVMSAPMSGKVIPVNVIGGKVASSTHWQPSMIGITGWVSLVRSTTSSRGLTTRYLGNLSPPALGDQKDG